MQWKTDVLIPEYDNFINYKSKIACFGSCFAQNMGNRLAAAKFDTTVNPLGIVYNPVSLAKILQFVVDCKVVSKSDLILHNELFCHLDFHSQFNSLHALDYCDKVNAAITQTHAYLKTAKLLILTLGTAIVFKDKESDSVVNNCHKLPSSQFKKSTLTQTQCNAAMQTLIDTLLNFNPNLQILLTVSPVRHLRHGAIENNRSKSRLLLTAEYLEQMYSSVAYFPAYEILIDELRDYRFMDTDLVHPNHQAIHYIWEKLLLHCADTETQQLYKRIEKIILQQQHQPLFPHTKANLAFRESLDRQIALLKTQHPEIEL